MPGNLRKKFCPLTYKGAAVHGVVELEVVKLSGRVLGEATCVCVLRCLAVLPPADNLAVLQTAIARQEPASLWEEGGEIKGGF